MKMLAAAVAVLAPTPHAHADLSIFDPPQGLIGSAIRLSGNGEVAMVMLEPAIGPGSRRVFTRDAAGWNQLPGTADDDLSLGISWDGGSVLTQSFADWDVESISLHRGGVLHQVATGQMGYHTGHLTRDGSTVYGTVRAPDTDDTRLYRWHDGTTVDLGSIGPEYGFVGNLLATDDGSRLVFSAYGNRDYGDPGFSRIVVRDQKGTVQLAPLLNADYVGSWAAAISADGRTILGVESGLNIGGGRSGASWLLEDGNATMITADGLDRIEALGMSDDASVVVGVGYESEWDTRSFVWFRGGGVIFADDLLRRNGLEVTATQDVWLWSVSADGSLAAGVIIDSSVGSHSPEWQTYFTVSVPAPSALLPLAGLAALARRRR